MNALQAIIKFHKTLLMTLLVLTTLFTSSGYAAFFDYFKLTMVVYDPNTDEMVRDVGGGDFIAYKNADIDTQGKLDLSRQNYELLPPGSFGPEYFNAVDGWTTLNATFYSHFQPRQAAFIATTSKIDTGFSLSSLSSFTTMANNIALEYMDGGAIGIGPASGDNAYHRLMNSNLIPGGSFAGFHNHTPYLGEVNLAPLQDGQSVDMYLYCYISISDAPVALDRGPDPSTDYYAAFRLNPDGSVTLNPPVVNRLPEANAGDDQSVNELQEVVLVGSGTDPDGAGDIESYSWSQTGNGPTVTIEGDTTTRASFIAPEISGESLTLEFTLTVTDKSGAGHSDTVLVTVNDIGTVNTPPQIQSVSGSPLQVPAQGQVTLSGTALDADGDALTYAWRQSAPAQPAGSLTDDYADDPDAVYTAPAVSEETQITLTLTVDDGNGGTDTRDLTITVAYDANTPPVADAIASPSLVEVGEIQSVALDGSASEDAEDGSNLTFLWAQTGGPITVTIDNADAAVAGISIPADATEGTLAFTLTVTDSGGLSHTAECNVQLTAAGGGRPPVAVAGDSRTLFVGQEVRLDGSASTDPDDDIALYAWEQLDGPVTVQLTAVSDAVTTFTAPSITTESADFSFRLTVEDDAGFKSTDTVTITIFKNHPPTTPSSALINLPGYDYAESKTASPVLIVNSAQDEDADDDLTYIFEIYPSAALVEGERVGRVTGIAPDGAAGATISWTDAPALNENTLYYWRARAHDGKEEGPWMDTAIILINADEEAPTIPAVSSPADGTMVDTLAPALEVTNATDPDLTTPTYEFRIYTGADDAVDQPHIEAIDVIENPSGATQWTVAPALEEGLTYWWRARAKDATGRYSDWTEPSAFTVNSENAAPSEVIILSPEDESEVTESILVVEIENSIDSDGDPLVYYFELDTVNTFDSESIVTSGAMAETEGETTWAVPVSLEENTLYHLRVKASEAIGDAESGWTVISFRMNQFNEAPGVPTLQYPENETQVTTLSPLLTITPADPADPDQDPVVYDIEVFATGDMVTPVASTGGISEEQWTVTSGTLKSGKKYHWRARAVDAHGLEGEWSELFSFITNGNFYRPSAPTILSPYGGGIVNTRRPTLAVLVPADGDGNALQVVFELYRNSELTDPAGYARIAKGELATTWEVDSTLDDRVRYYWRAMATDGEKESPWSAVSEFLVDENGISTAPQVRVWAVENYDPTMPWATVVRVDRAGTPLFRTEAEFPAGAMSDTAAVYIGEAVSGVPAMNPERTSIGKVVDFGPSNIAFDHPVTIKLPYSEDDLILAGIASPDDLAVMTYNETLFEWEEIPVEAVDAELNLVTCKVEHLSMYTLATSLDDLTPDDTDDTNTGGSGGGGGCFINSIAGF